MRDRPENIDRALDAVRSRTSQLDPDLVSLADQLAASFNEYLRGVGLNPHSRDVQAAVLATAATIHMLDEDPPHDGHLQHVFGTHAAVIMLSIAGTQPGENLTGGPA